MSRAKILVREMASPGTVHEYDPIYANLKLNGKKKSDELEVGLSMAARARNGDSIYYVEDIADLDYCVAIWNFQFSGYDDRGFDIDVSGDILDDRFAYNLAGKFYAQYALEFDSASSWLRVNTVSSTKVDFSGQFDVYVWFTPKSSQSQTKPKMYSHLGARGIEIGIDTSGGAGNWRPLVKVANGTTTVELIGTTTTITPSVPNLLRVFRGTDNIIRMEVMGVQDATTLTETASLVSTDANILGGGNNSITDRYDGWLHQVRVYCGNTLDSDDAFAILAAKPQPFTMRFGGVIWDNRDATTTKIVKAQSFAQSLGNWIVGIDTITEAPISGVTRTNNVYASGQDTKLIIRDMVNNLDSDFRVKGTVSGPMLTGAFTADGQFIDLAQLLTTFSLMTFFTTPRKIIIIESFVGIDTQYGFSQDSTTTRYDITNDETTDIVTINDVTLVNSAGGTVHDQNIAAGDIIHSLKLNAPQFGNDSDLGSLAAAILALSSSAIPRYAVKIGCPISHVRFNMNVDVDNSMKNISDRQPVAMIERKYPSGETKIHVGQYVADFYDLGASNLKVQRGLQSNTSI